MSDLAFDALGALAGAGLPPVSAACGWGTERRMPDRAARKRV